MAVRKKKIEKLKKAVLVKKATLAKISASDPNSGRLPDGTFAVGNQLSVGNEGRPPDKWTQEVLSQLAQDLREWMQRPESIYVKTFCYEKRFLASQAEDFCAKSPEFAEAWKESRQWQEQKLVGHAIFRKTSEGMTKFVLANCHGWREKVEASNDIINPLAAILSKIAENPKKR